MITAKERETLIAMVRREVLGCEVCGQADRTRLRVHHIKRRASGGKDIPRNLMVVCDNCHKDLHHDER